MTVLIAADLPKLIGDSSGVVSHSSMLMTSDMSSKWNLMTSKSQTMCQVRPENGKANNRRDKDETEKIRIKNDEVI